jgi:hypothetical protein
MEMCELSPIFGCAFFYAHFSDEAAFFGWNVWVVVYGYFFAEPLVDVD